MDQKDSIILSKNQQLGEMTAKLQTLQGQHAQYVRAIGRVRKMVNECDILVKNLPKVREKLADPQRFEKFSRELLLFQRYVADTQRDFELIVQGYAAEYKPSHIEIAELLSERLEDESPGSDIGEGGKQGDTGEEHQDNSG